jgi:excisionase family DNA binding protein
MDALLLKPEEAAQCLGICRSKIYELMRAGALESVRIGASRRIPAAAVARFVEQLRGGTEPAA